MCIGYVKPNKIMMMVSKVMVKLWFTYHLKQDLVICDDFLSFPFDLSSFVWLAL
jgi:hypothetical protein